MTEKLNESDKPKEILLLVSGQEKNLCSIRIPLIAVKCTALLLVLLIIGMAGFFVNYRQTIIAASTKTTELERLQQNNDDQAKQIEQLTNTTVSLQAKMERLNSLDAEIRKIVNNEDTTTTSRSGLVRPSATYKGQGGPLVQPDINAINQLANDLQVEAAAREQSLIELKQEVLARQARLAATPSFWPTNGDVTSRFGLRNSPWDGSGDFHPGIDIANNIGTPIFATADGEVVRSDWSDGYGKMVQINHANGISTIYGHNSQIAVHVGQVVKKGQVIAYMGSTGNSTGPHCHYEIRVNGTAVDPASFLE